MSSIEERKRSLEYSQRNLDKFNKNIHNHLCELDETDKDMSSQLRLSIMNYIANTKTYCNHPDFFDVGI